MTPSANKTQYKVELLPLEKLVPYVRNARTHSDEQLAQIMGSLKEFGWTNPILIDSANTIVAGHGRVRAAMRAKEAGIEPHGWTHGIDVVPCIRLGHLTDAQRRAYTIADNKLALNAAWDYEMLTVELDDLVKAGFDHQVMGFSAADIAEIMDAYQHKPADDLTHKDDEPYRDTREIVVTVSNFEFAREAFETIKELCAANAEWNAAVHEKGRSGQ